MAFSIHRAVFLVFTLLQAADCAKKVLYSAEPTQGTTDAIDVTFYLKAAGDLHFVVVLDGQQEPTAMAIKQSKQGASGVAAAQTIEVKKPGRVTHRVSGLTAGTKYDLYFVSEVLPSLTAHRFRPETKCAFIPTGQGLQRCLRKCEGS